jgi:DNA-binding MarR family transcriptional regulator
MSVDLSSRQTAILLHIYLLHPPHSIKKLAMELPISKPAICRAVDALENAKLLKRTRDKNDKRNVILQRTVKGSVYLSEFADIILSMSKD